MTIIIAKYEKKLLTLARPDREKLEGWIELAKKRRRMIGDHRAVGRREAAAAADVGAARWVFIILIVIALVVEVILERVVLLLRLSHVAVVDPHQQAVVHQMEAWEKLATKSIS